MVYISQNKAAKELGINQSVVSRHIKNGRLTAPAINEQKQVCVAEARKQLKANLDPARGQGKIHKTAEINKGNAAQVAASEDDNKTSKGYAQARAMKAMIDVKMANLDYEERMGNLIKKEDIYDTFFLLMREQRDALLKIEDRIGAIVAHQTDEHTCKQIIGGEIRQALKAAEEKLLSMGGESVGK